MENQINIHTTESAIGGTVYVVESRVSDSAKESAYSKLKRLITVNAKSLSKLSDSSSKKSYKSKVKILNNPEDWMVFKQVQFAALILLLLLNTLLLLRALPFSPFESYVSF
ncbi:transposon-encoded TnpW family protein [Ureibacillus thermosphaericus]|uniref:transposon-encoded TnpW family protein n=1 Tax=Ureibacillus thermosphaericus TaxID=51173 RepID=UPI000BBCEAD9|nr:transposon-encoded TnpW family protein [Ureibacillus thermosphaericus]